MAGFKEYQMLFSLSAKTESGFQNTFQAGSAEVAKLQASINQMNKTQADISSYQKQQNAIDKTKSRLELYEAQLKTLQSATAATSKEEAELTNEILAKKKQIDDVTEKLDKQNAALSETGQRLKDAGIDTNNLGAAEEKLKSELDAVKNSQAEVAGSTQRLSSTMQGLRDLIVAVGAERGLQALYSSLKQCSETAAEFETAMASVKRTVGGEDSFIDDLGDRFLELSTQMPITATELANIATTAGQLGIAQENVEGFTTVMAQLATTTDLTADNAATMLAQFANITGTTEYDRLGATVAALGDTTATTASKIVDMSQGMAAAASLAGMSETDILAIAAAVGSLGIEAQAGSTSMSQLITSMYKATETGDNLEAFASVAGMSAEEFAAAWQGDPVTALDTFIQGLNDTERNGKSAMVVLDELGITNVRQVKSILGLASAGDLLSNSIKQASAAWTSNTALTEKAGIMYNTTEAQLTMMQNAANNVAVAFGDALNPTVSGAASAITALLEPVAEFIADNPAIAKGLTATAGALGLATVAVSAYEAKVKLATIAQTIFNSTTPIGWIAGAAVGIGALVAGISLLTSGNGEAAESFEELQAQYDSLDDSIEEQENVIALVDQYKKLTKEMESIEEVDPKDVKLKATLENNGVTEENLQLVDDLKSRIENKTGEIKQILEISGAENVTEDNINAIVELANNAEEGDYELKQQLALLGVDDISDADMERLRELASEITAESATLSQTLELHGFENYEDMKAAAELPISSKTAEILVNMKQEGYTDVTQKLSDLGEKVVSTKSQLTEAETTLGNLQEKAEKVQEAINGTKRWEKSKREAYEADLSDLNTQIEEQENKVNHLKNAHDQLVTQYEETAAAAAEVKAKEEALKAAHEALGLATEGAKESVEEQTEAIRQQAEAEEALLKAQQALIVLKASESMKEDAKKYASAAYDYDLASAEVEAATNRMDSLDGPQDLGTQLAGIVETMGDLMSYENETPLDWDSAEIKEYRREVEALMSEATGVNKSYGNYDQMKRDVQSIVGSETAGLVATVNLGNEIEASTEKAAEAKAQMDAFVESTATLIESGALEAGDVRKILTEAMTESGQSLENVDRIMNQVDETLEQHKQALAEAAEQEESAKEAAADYGNAMDETTVKQSERVQTIISQIDELKQAYDDAYKTAYDSMNGQFDLFEKVKNISVSKNLKKDLNSYREALESQTAYMENYASNYETVADKIKSVDTSESGAAGDALLASLSDGSEESAQILANLASASTEQIQGIVSAYADNQTAMDQYAAKVAETETDFSTKMTAMQQELESTVQAMDFSTEAAANAKSSLEAFISMAESYEGKAKIAYAKVAKAAASGLEFNPTYVRGYASGTTSAEAGVRLVGEKGPELVAFKGGETVLNAAQTQKALQAEPLTAVSAASGKGTSTNNNSYNVSVTIPSINAAGMSADELMDAISGSLKDKIIDTMSEYEEDNERRNLRYYRGT